MFVILPAQFAWLRCMQRLRAYWSISKRRDTCVQFPRGAVEEKLNNGTVLKDIVERQAVVPLELAYFAF